MIISKKHQFAYLAHPKTGTTSMSKILGEHYGGKPWSILKVDHENWRHHAYLHQSMGSYFVFATVRNPYTHELSKYCFFHRKKDFAKYIKSLTFVNSQKYQFDAMNRKGFTHPKCAPYKVDAFVRLEHVEEDFNNLPFVEEKINKFPIWTVTRRTPPKYTEELAEMVYKARKADFEEFGYNKELPQKLLETPPILPLL